MMNNTENMYNQRAMCDIDFWKKGLQYNVKPSKMPTTYNAFPKDCKFAYMTPGHYVTGFRFLDFLKDDIATDLKELKKLLFIEDPKQAHKWGLLRSRIPYAEGRITDLPGTKTMHYNNYCLRNLTPESTSLWRKSIQNFEEENVDEDNIFCLDEKIVTENSTVSP